MEDLQELKVIAEQRELVRRPAGAGMKHGVVADYNAEELADVSEDEKRLERQSSVRKGKPRSGRKCKSRSPAHSTGTHTL